MERVSSKATRPYPPPVAMDDHWVHGDLVEVLHNFAWKTTVLIVEVMGGKLSCLVTWIV